MKKVKPHATESEMARGLSSPTLKYGNDRADHYAAEGAAIYEVPDQTESGGVSRCRYMRHSETGSAGSGWAMD